MKYRIVAITNSNMKGSDNWTPYTIGHWKQIMDNLEYSFPDLNSAYIRKQTVSDYSHCWFIVEEI